MKISIANYSKGQMKIQQMAFVLVAIIVFFGIVALFYFSVRISSLKGDVKSQNEEDARQIVAKISSTPEFSFNALGDCSNCVDGDKLMELKERISNGTYKNFWDFDYLKISKVYPVEKGECTRASYPKCKDIILITNKGNIGNTVDAFVSLCYWDDEKGGYFKCELGRIYASSPGITNG